MLYGTGVLYRFLRKISNFVGKFEKFGIFSGKIEIWGSNETSWCKEVVKMAFLTYTDNPFTV